MSITRAVPPAVLAGILFIAEAVAEVAHHQADHFSSAGDYVIESLFGAGLAAAAIAFWLLRDAEARVRLGATIGAAGQGALALCSVATIVHGSDALGPLFVLGLLGSVVGPIVIATSGPRARAIGIALTLGLVVSLVVGSGGAAVLGLAWLSAAALLRDRGESMAAALSDRG